MSAENDLALAYHMGYDDALAKRKPDASKAQVLASYDLAAENARLRELVRHMNTCIEHYEPDGSIGCEHCPLDNDTGNCDYERRMRELGVEVDG